MTNFERGDNVGQTWFYLHSQSLQLQALTFPVFSLVVSSQRLSVLWLRFCGEWASGRHLLIDPDALNNSAGATRMRRVHFNLARNKAQKKRPRGARGKHVFQQPLQKNQQSEWRRTVCGICIRQSSSSSSSKLLGEAQVFLLWRTCRKRCNWDNCIPVHY